MMLNGFPFLGSCALTKYFWGSNKAELLYRETRGEKSGLKGSARNALPVHNLRSLALF